MQIASTIPFARELTASEKSDETNLGDGTWRMVVIDVWVRRENIH